MESKIHRKLASSISRAVDERAGEIIEFTRNLLRIPTENHPPSGDERLGQEFLAEELSRLGMDIDMFQPDEVPGLTDHPAYHPTGSSTVRHEFAGRPNLVGRLRGRGEGRSLILAGHMDVVPPGNLANWSHDPWGAEMDEHGRIYARGAVDMKGPLAAMAMAVRVLKELGILLKGDLILESVVDEEFGGGNGTLATILRGYRADAVLSGEPSSLAVCPTTLGCVSLSFTMKGVSAHGYEQWKGINAVDGGVFFQRQLPRWHARRNARASAFPLLARRKIPLPLLTRSFLAGANLGGAAIPDTCEIRLWLGVAPGERWSDMEAEIREFVQEVATDPEWPLPEAPAFSRMGRFLEASEIDPGHPFSRLVGECCEAASGEPPRYECGTSGDLFIYTNYGHMDGLICGPGDLFLAHGPDEYIAVHDLLQAVKTYALVACEWCGVEAGA